MATHSRQYATSVMLISFFFYLNRNQLIKLISQHFIRRKFVEQFCSYWEIQTDRQTYSRANKCVIWISVLNMLQSISKDANETSVSYKDLFQGSKLNASSSTSYWGLIAILWHLCVLDACLQPAVWESVWVEGVATPAALVCVVPQDIIFMPLMPITVCTFI